MLQLNFHFHNLICIYKPQISAYIGISHGGKKVHIFSYLYVVFVFGAPELEVDDYHSFPVGHHSVRSAPYYVSRIVVERKYLALIKELPAWRKPVGNTLVCKSFGKHVAHFVG